MFTALLFLMNFISASNSQDSKKERYFVLLKIVFKVAFVVAVIASVLIAGYFGYKKYKFSKKVEEIIKFLESRSNAKEEFEGGLLKEVLEMIALFKGEKITVNCDSDFFFKQDLSPQGRLEFNKQLRELFNALYSEKKSLIEDYNFFAVDLTAEEKEKKIVETFPPLDENGSRKFGFLIRIILTEKDRQIQFYEKKLK